MAEPGLDVEIDASEIEELLNQFPEYQDIIVNQIRIAMKSSLLMFQELIQGHTPRGATSNLAESFVSHRRVRRGEEIFTGSVTTFLPYGFPIERGRTPGKRMPPVDAIEFWVKRKLGITKNSRGIAFAIALKIAKSGFRMKDGYRMVETSFKEGTPNAIKLFDLGVQKAVKEIDSTVDQID